VLRKMLPVPPSLSSVKQIIYLGGLGERSSKQSPHLRSRHDVGDILRTSKIPVTELRAGVIIGPGSASFEMIHHRQSVADHGLPTLGECENTANRDR
jgi:uncharacterized protein YbjT (DUF2867 family)